MAVATSSIYNKLMKFLGRVLILIVGVMFLLIVWFAVRPAYMLNQLKADMSSEDVVSVLGKPAISRQNHDGLCEKEILDDETCDEFINAGSTSIVYWKLGIDTWIVVGFDEDNKLRFKLTVDS